MRPTLSQTNRQKDRQNIQAWQDKQQQVQNANKQQLGLRRPASKMLMTVLFKTQGKKEYNNGDPKGSVNEVKKVQAKVSNVQLFLYLSGLSVCVSLYVCLSVFVRTPPNLSVCLSVGLFVCLRLSVCLSVFQTPPERLYDTWKVSHCGDYPTQTSLKQQQNQKKHANQNQKCGHMNQTNAQKYKLDAKPTQHKNEGTRNKNTRTRKA
jgi:hypothetical protein